MRWAVERLSPLYRSKQLAEKKEKSFSQYHTACVYETGMKVELISSDVRFRAFPPYKSLIPRKALVLVPLSFHQNSKTYSGAPTQILSLNVPAPSVLLTSYVHFYF